MFSHQVRLHSYSHVVVCEVSWSGHAVFVLNGGSDVKLDLYRRSESGEVPQCPGIDALAVLSKVELAGARYGPGRAGDAPREINQQREQCGRQRIDDFRLPDIAARLGQQGQGGKHGREDGGVGQVEPHGAVFLQKYGIIFI